MNARMRGLLGAGLLALLFVPVYQARGEESERRTFLDAWSYSRERKTITGSNRVTCRFTVKNISEKPLDGVHAMITFHDSMGQQVGQPVQQELGRIPPKETKQFQAFGEFIPIFNSYQIHLRHRDGKELWHCPSDIGNPEPKVENLQKGIGTARLLGSDLSPDRYGRMAGNVRVKNEGDQEAKNVQIHITFYGNPPAQPRRPAPPPKDPKAAKTQANADPLGEHATNDNAPVLKEWSGKLDSGTLKAGEERVIQLIVPQAVPKGYSGHRVRITCDETAPEKAMSGGEFANAEDLEAAHFSFARAGKDNADLEVRCKLRNGLKDTAKDIKVDLAFFLAEKGEKKEVKRHAESLKETIAPGEVKEIAFTVPAMPKFDSFEQALDYKTGDAKPSTPGPVAKLDFQNTPTVEVLLKDFKTQDDGTVLVVCAARNGRPNFVKDIKIKAHFLKADGSELTSAEKVLAETVAPGEVRNFLIRAANAKEYAKVTTEVGFTEQRPAQKTAEAAETGAAEPAPAETAEQPQ
ncbi:MAG: hypothetical protein AMXMBFR7_40230 [Planctomycetota bacterium]